jgi:hypothetical protein
MAGYKSLDSLVRARLRTWPQRPPGAAVGGPAIGGAAPDAWLRGRPADVANAHEPYLKLPGSDRMRTLPDGLWLNFGGTPAEPFADILAIEACCTLPNLLDKRSIFAPSTHSLMAGCPVPWLIAQVSINDPTPRWRVTGVVVEEPSAPLILPVRDVRVLYALKQHHYSGFAASQVPHTHEFFMPMDALVDVDAPRNPAVRALFARASARAHFMVAG